MEDLTLFANSSESPLAERMRPTGLDSFSGQSHLLTKTFRQMIERDQWTGLIFWGPPGTGKTTLATVIASLSYRPFEALSAVMSGVKEIREVLERSKASVQTGKKATILFLDEIHRLNKAQQDVLLPYLERGWIRLIGATTENPSFAINNAIASRCLVFPFKTHDTPALLTILQRALPKNRVIENEVLEKIADVSGGDARRALNLLENILIAVSDETPIGLNEFEELRHSQSLYYDKKAEAHYDTISAFIKSVRGSDPDAALYYLARMLEGGEDPAFISRRLIILASEDIGNANPMGLVVATAAHTATETIGMPEARIILSQAVVYLACSEKSNRSYLAIDKAIEKVRETGPLDIPMNIRNAPTQMMKEWGYGKGYRYPHDFPGGWVEQNYLPEKIAGERFYIPSDIGSEKKLEEFLKSRRKTT